MEDVKDNARPGTGTILVAPPILAALPGSGMRKAVFCGARSPKLVSDLRKAAKASGMNMLVQSQSKSSAYAPSRIEIQSISAHGLEALAERVKISYVSTPPARTILSVCGSLADYITTLSWSCEDELNWSNEDFDTDNLRFTTRIGTPVAPRLSSYQNPANYQRKYWFHRYGEHAEVDPDWGRYAVLAMKGRRVVSYDEQTKSVLVPLGAPLPVLLSRALALCSGCAPRIPHDSKEPRRRKSIPCEIFRDIPPTIFQAVMKLIEEVPKLE